ncbi:MAG: helix-turn-helix transcriptional regulator [Hyphomicrobiaceae bacterium]
MRQSSSEDDREEAGSSPKRANPIDVYVGSRIRLRRMLIGMSQERLGELMGLTFQQIQKYEKGVNRVGASRLHRLSGILQVPVQFFFDELPVAGGPSGQPGFAESASEAHILDFLNTREGLELNRAFVQITDPQVRRRVVDLVKTLAGGDDAGGLAPPKDEA